MSKKMSKIIFLCFCGEFCLFVIYFYGLCETNKKKQNKNRKQKMENEQFDHNQNQNEEKKKEEEKQEKVTTIMTHQEMFEKGVELAFGMGKQEGVNKVKAFQHFQQSHQAGNPLAPIFMARLLFEGEGGIKQNKEEAEKLCVEAAKYNTIFELSSKGDSMAQFSLGFMHFHGLGVKQDRNKSFSLFLESANQGNSISQYFVGLSYYFGFGV